jgi:hypothetical protein
MRARHQFRPSVDFMPSRFALSGVAAALDPMDSTTVPTSTPPASIDPMDPTGTTGINPSPSSPSTGISGSFVTTSPAMAVC